MHLFKQFWKLLLKNKTGLVIYMAISVAITGFVAMAAADQYKNEDDGLSISIDISYIDNDDSELSRGLIEFFSKYYNCLNFAGKTEEQISDMVFFTTTKFHMDIPEGFQQHINAEKEINIEYVVSAENASYSNSCANDINTFVNSYISYKKLGFSDEESVSRTAVAMSEKPVISIYSEGKEQIKTTAIETVIGSLAVYMYYISFGIICLTGGIAVVRTNENLVKKRIAVAPVSAEKLTFSNTFGIYSFGLLIWSILTAAMYIAGNGVGTISERGWVISLGMLVMMITNCSVAIFIAAFGPKSNTMSMIVNVVGLSFCFLGGVFVPQWLLGEEVIAAAKFIPSYWATYAMNMCFPNSGAGLTFDISEVFRCYGIELLFAGVFVMAAIIVKKAKSQQ